MLNSYHFPNISQGNSTTALDKRYRPTTLSSYMWYKTFVECLIFFNTYVKHIEPVKIDQESPPDHGQSSNISNNATTSESIIADAASKVFMELMSKFNNNAQTNGTGLMQHSAISATSQATNALGTTTLNTASLGLNSAALIQQLQLTGSAPQHLLTRPPSSNGSGGNQCKEIETSAGVFSQFKLNNKQKQPDVVMKFHTCKVNWIEI